MKQLTLNISKEKVSFIRVMIGLALAIMTVIFSFMPILTIDLSNSTTREVVNTGLTEMQKEVPELEIVTVPEEITVTNIKLIKSVSLLVRALQVTFGMAREETSVVTQEQKEKNKANQEKLLKETSSKQGQEALIMVIAIFGQVTDFSTDKSTSSTENTTVSSKIMKIVSIMAVFVTMGYILLWPILLVLLFVINCIRILTNRKNLSKVAGKNSNLLARGVILTVFIAIIFKIMPGFGWGYGLITMFILGIISVGVDLVATRSRRYQPDHMKYIDITQICSIGALAGFLVFFFSLMKADVLTGFLPKFEEYMKALEVSVTGVNGSIKSFAPNMGEFTPGMTYIVDVVLIYLYAVLVAAAGGDVIRCIIENMTLTYRKRSKKRKLMACGIIGLLGGICAIVESNLTNAKIYAFNPMSKTIVVSGSGHIYELTGSTKAAVIGMIVGAVIIIAACITRNILHNKFCPNINDVEERSILLGNAPEVGGTTTTVEEVAPIEETVNKEE